MTQSKSQLQKDYTSFASISLLTTLVTNRGGLTEMPSSLPWSARGLRTAKDHRSGDVFSRVMMKCKPPPTDG